MIPPLLSSTMNGEDILGKSNKNNNAKTQTSSEKATGRPKKEESEKSDKTI
jgi:hypothetical protein